MALMIMLYIFLAMLIGLLNSKEKQKKLFICLFIYSFIVCKCTTQICHILLVGSNVQHVCNILFHFMAVA